MICEACFHFGDPLLEKCQQGAQTAPSVVAVSANMYQPALVEEKTLVRTREALGKLACCRGLWRHSPAMSAHTTRDSEAVQTPTDVMRYIYHALGSVTLSWGVHREGGKLVRGIEKGMLTCLRRSGDSGSDI